MPELTSTRCNFSANADARTVNVYAKFYERGIITDPERVIMLALFEHAMSERDDVWIRRDNSDYENGFYIYSFQNCCESLGIDYQAARKALIKQFAEEKQSRRKITEHIQEKPGVVYTHGYGACGQSVKCKECKQRYLYTYNLMVLRPESGAMRRGAYRVRHNHNGAMKIGGVQY